MREQAPRNAGFCGCDRADYGPALISIDDALSIMADTITPIGRTERIPLARAAGRVLAEAVVASSDAPPFDNSAVDGYAICLDQQSTHNALILDVRERVVAGDLPSRCLDYQSAMQVMTGAPLPAGTQAVVMQEDVARIADKVKLHTQPEPGSNMRMRGEDLRQGQVVLEAGSRLTARAIAVAAAAGAQEVIVRAPLRLGLLVTGSEVAAINQSTLKNGTIWDVNSPTLAAAMQQSQLEVVHQVVVGDSADDIQSAMSELSKDVDLLVTTGGVSVGEEDHVKPGFERIGGEVLFSGVAVKPGKPVTFGRFGRSMWLGLPGNPQAAYLMWFLFGKPACSLLLDEDSKDAARYCVVLDHDLTHKPGRCELRLARISSQDGFGRQRVRFGSATFSGRVGAMAEADGVIILPAETETLPQGSMVEFLPFTEL